MFPRGITGRFDFRDPACVDWLIDAVRTLESAAAKFTHQISDNANAIKALDAGKADKSGVYPDLIAGNLHSDASFVDSQPYYFRPVAGSADVGQSKTWQLSGGSVVWNQIAPTNTDDWSTVAGSSFSISDNGRTFKVTSKNDNNADNRSRFEIKPNHVYYASCATITNSADTAQGAMSFRSGTRTQLKSKNTAGAFMYKTPNDTATYTFGLWLVSSAPNGVYATFTDVILIDVTVMFGATVADYIYAMETANAGDGVAWFKRLFPATYYSYCKPTIYSVYPSIHITSGFNAYNNGSADVCGGYVYQITGNYTALTLTDYNGTNYDITVSDTIFTPVTSGVITVTGGDDTTCIHLVWDGEKNNTYEAFENNIEILSAYELCGLPSVSDSKFSFAGDTYTADGTITQIYKHMTFTSAPELATATTGKQYVKITLSTADKGVTDGIVLSNQYPIVTAAPSGEGTTGIRLSTSSIYIFDDRFTDLETANTILAAEKPEVVYTLYTSRTINASPFTSPLIIDNWGTEKFTDYEFNSHNRDVIIPTGQISTYDLDLKAKLEMLPDSPDNNGLYLLKHNSDVNTWDVYPIPAPPTTSGSYSLTVTVSGSGAVYSWEANASPANTD